MTPWVMSKLNWSKCYPDAIKKFEENNVTSLTRWSRFLQSRKNHIAWIGAVIRDKNGHFVAGLTVNNCVLHIVQNGIEKKEFPASQLIGVSWKTFMWFLMISSKIVEEAFYIEQTQ